MTDQQIPTSPAPTQPAAPKTRWWRNKKVRLAITIIGIGLIMLGRFGLVDKRETQRATDVAKQEITSFLVGDCVTLSAKGDDVHRTDCATDPSFTVGAALDSDAPCANTNYIGYDWTLDQRIIGRLCLVENLTVGHCYRPTDTGNLEQLDCTAATDDKAYKVVQRIETDNSGQCPAHTSAYNYPTPARTYCFGPTSATRAD